MNHNDKPLDPIEHTRRIEQTAIVISGTLGFLLGAALVFALWAASVRWPELF